VLRADVVVAEVVNTTLKVSMVQNLILPSFIMQNSL
jgi:hypothetical protein